MWINNILKIYRYIYIASLYDLKIKIDSTSYDFLSLSQQESFSSFILQQSDLDISLAWHLIPEVSIHLGFLITQILFFPFLPSMPQWSKFSKCIVYHLDKHLKVSPCFIVTWFCQLFLSLSLTFSWHIFIFKSIKWYFIFRLCFVFFFTFTTFGQNQSWELPLCFFFLTNN